MQIYVKEIRAKIPNSIIDICHKLKANNYQCFLVGGFLRNFFLNLPCLDFDIATDAEPSQIKDLFPDCFDIGGKYGTISLKEADFSIEITTFRTESDYQDQRHPKNVGFVSDLQTDLKRRDFTINSLAYDPFKKKLFDYFNGLEDIEKKLIRTVGDPQERFREDALRILRAFRFLAKLDFTISDLSKEAIVQEKFGLLKISKERISKEILEIIKARSFKKAFLAMSDLGILEICLEELSSFKKENLADILTYTVKLDVKLRLVFLAYLLKNSSKAKLFLEKLILDKKTLNEFLLTIKKQNFLYSNKISNSALSYFLTSIKNKELWLDLYIAIANYEKRHNKKELEQMIKRVKNISANLITLENLAIKGNDLIKLGVPKGKKLGIILEKLLDIAREYPEKNTWSNLIFYAKELKENLKC